MLRSTLILLVAILISACSGESEVPMTPTKVEIVATQSGYQLLRDGQPYVVKGAGMAVDDLERFASHGGNSIRNWSTSEDYQDTMSLLDSAYRNGVTVALCLSVRAERHGFDYSDASAVAEQLAWARGEVEKYKDHPALLAWVIGNELNHSYTNPAVYDAVNDIAEMIHEIDPNHPTTTTLAEPDESVLAEVLSRAPALDFISVQMYGALFGLPGLLEEVELDKPLMVTEWGTVGYWEMRRTSWDIPHETTSSEKANLIQRGHDEVLSQLGDRLLGSYIFLWGQKQERTPTWFGLFTESGEETEAVDVMHRIWTGSWPENRTPQLNSIEIDGKSYADNVVLQAGVEYPAMVDVTDPDGDKLSFHWELKKESESTKAGGDREQRIPNIDGALSTPEQNSTAIVISEPGNYRLFAYAYDGQGNAAHANIPIRVAGKFEQSPDALLVGETMAVAYSGYREGQHPDRGKGAVNPSRAEVLEDLNILVENNLNLVRMYDAGENTVMTLELIREHQLPIKMMLGAWLKAEFSNHEGCPWLDEPIPQEELVANTLDNASEIRRTIQLANEYDDIIVSVNVGNEALVDWNDHMVPVEKVIRYVREVKAAIEQPVTVADNYEWWIRDGKALAAEVDFIGVHTYPVWESRTIDQALSYTIDNINGVRVALPDKPIAILEAGWATTSSEFAELAGEDFQSRYFAEMSDWAKETNTTIFFFEAFDEPWKGSERDPLGAEKHWGLFFVDRTPKKVMQK